MDNDAQTTQGMAETVGSEAITADTQNQDLRRCWVCLGIEQEDFCLEQDVVWVCPCKCKGTMKWVHEECLQRWIDEKQKQTNLIKISCSHCKTHYLLSFPPANRFVRLIEQYDKLLYGSSPFVAVTVVLGSIYLCCASYGFISIIQVMGYDDGRRLIDEADPILLVVGLPVIPITLVLTKLIKWEDFLLRLWRTSAYKIPRPLSYLIAKPPIRPRANCDQILMDPGFNDPLGCTRMMCGALLLPSVSTIIGRLVFSKFTESHWRQSLLGGLAFLVIKGALKIYLRKSQYIRYSQRRIRDYNPAGKSTRVSDQTTSANERLADEQAGSNGNAGSGNLDGASNNDNNNNSNSDNDSSRQNSDAETSDEDSDNQDQIQRRPMFSMTISLGG